MVLQEVLEDMPACRCPKLMLQDVPAFRSLHDLLAVFLVGPPLMLLCHLAGLLMHLLKLR